MRIISGSARGKRLRTFKTNTIRPTSDRIREALFSILTSKIGSLEGVQVLDICAGTGALGIEALSRGAQRGVFIDNNRQAAEIITHNCRVCEVEERAEIIKGGFATTLPHLGESGFELIFVDPPYNSGMLPEIVTLISTLNLLAPGGIICAEESKSAHVPPDIGHYSCIDMRTYGDTCIYLFSAATA